MVSANNLKQYTKPDVSQITLDIIEAIKTRDSVQFKYGHDVIREIKPIDFYGDFDGFGGTDINLDEKIGNYRRFSFNKIEDWLGIPIQYKVYVELEMSGYPTDNDVKEAMEDVLEDIKPVVYTLKPQGL